MTSAARDLMDTGTAAPWRLSRVHGRAVLIRDCRDDVLLADATLDTDARKIVLSVNALPLVDALCEATKYHEFTSCDEPDCDVDCPGQCLACGRDYPCPTAAARDALEAALRGEGE